MKNLVFDIGGTNTRVGFFRDSKLIEKDKFKTVNSNKLLKELVNVVLRFKRKYRFDRFDGIAVSAPGYLEAEKLKLTAPVNLKGVKNLNLGRLKKFSKKVVLENDANCAALGALALEKGAGYKVRNIACFTLGTGFGCGLIVDRKLYVGKGNASEFGHITIDLDGKKCNCRNYGCLENYVSKKGLLRIMKKKGLKGNVFKLEDLAKKGNKKALAVYREFGRYLAVGLVNITNILDPDVIYLTGGLSKAGEFFVSFAVKEAKKRFFRGMGPRIKVYKGELSILGGLELLK